MKKFFFVILLLAGIAWLGWQILVKIDEQKALKGKSGGGAVAVETAPIKKLDLNRTGVYSGTVMPLSRSVLAPKVAGRLEKMMVNIGSAVKKGDLIAILDSEEYDQQVKQAEAELKVAEASLSQAVSNMDVARKDFERRKKLRDRQVLSHSEFDQAEARYRSAGAARQEALAQIEQKKAALEAVRVRLAYTRIYAFWEGGSKVRFVSERFVDEGTMLRANDPIAAIVDIESVIGVINVIEKDYGAIHLDQAAAIHNDANPGRTFTGRVVRKSPVLDEASRQARVEIEIPNPDHLLAPGMYIRAEIGFEEHLGATAAPLAALVKRNGATGLFVVDENGKKVRFTPITPGITSNGYIEILKPDLKGRVVTVGHHLLSDGSKIRFGEKEKKSKGGPPAQTKSPSEKSGG